MPTVGLKKRAYAVASDACRVQREQVAPLASRGLELREQRRSVGACVIDDGPVHRRYQQMRGACIDDLRGQITAEIAGCETEGGRQRPGVSDDGALLWARLIQHD